MTQENSTIHSSVIIENGAQIAKDVVIGPFCHIGKDAIIESGARLESNIILKGKLHISNDVKIFSFVTIGNESSHISIGEKTHVREFVQIGTQEDDNEFPKKITIGANNFLMGYVQILSGVKLGDFCILTNAVRLYENVTCEERVIIGGLSTIVSNTKIGTGVMIGGASLVNRDIPPFTLTEGNFASVKGLNVIGLRRRVQNSSEIDEIKAIFKSIFADGVDKELALEISTTHPNEYARRFAAFIAASDRL